MGTLVAVNTYANTVTFVTEKLIRSLRYVITTTGLDPNKLVGDWKSYELAIQTWLTSGHLRVVTLEIVTPALVLATRLDIEVSYSYGSGEGSMWVDTDALKYAIAKFGVLPVSCTYNIKIENAPGRPDVIGWGPGTYLSTEGFVKQGLGTTIGTSSIGAQASYWRKS
jgi:Bacterial HORMA domain 2